MAIQHREVERAPRRPPVHRDDRCPWCEQPIPHQKFVEITTKLAADEQARAKVAETRLRDELSKQKADIEKRAQARVAAVEAANAATLTAAVKAAKASEAVALAAADKAAKARESAARTAERRANQEQIAAADRARKAAERQLVDVRADQDKVLAKQRQEQRLVYDKALKGAIDVVKEQSFKEKQRLATKVDHLQRTVDAQRAAASGEGAAIVLADELKRAFPGDHIRAVGTQGANLIHEVIEEGRKCGVIVYDTRKRMAWRDSYVTRIRKDQLTANADHAIIATQAMPAGARHVHLEGQVIVANPARALVLVAILRRQIVQMSTLRMTLEDRADKRDRLYEFISTDRFRQLLDGIETGSEALLQLDVQEQTTHATTWRKRGELVKEMQRAHGLIESTINDVIGAVGVDT